MYNEDKVKLAKLIKDGVPLAGLPQLKIK